MALNLNETWNGEQLTDVRAFIQEQLKKGFVGVTTQPNVNGNVEITFTKADGSTVKAIFKAAESSSDTGFSTDLRLIRSQSVYGKGKPVTFNYRYSQTMDGEDYSNPATLVFSAYSQDKEIWNTTVNIHDSTSGTITIPGTTFNEIEGIVVIKGTSLTTFEGQDYTVERRASINIATCNIDFAAGFNLPTQVKGYTETQSLTEALINYIGTTNGNLMIYLDGVYLKTMKNISSGADVNLDIAMSEVTTSGKHTIQVVAQMEAGIDENDEILYIYSNSLIFDFYKGITGSHVGIQLNIVSSDIIEDPVSALTIDTEQYTNTDIKYTASTYDTTTNTYNEKTAVSVSKDNTIINNLAVSNTEVFTYSFRDTTINSYVLTFAVTGNNRKINISVQANSSGVNVASGLNIDISAAGRNNLENADKRNTWPFTDNKGNSYVGTLSNFIFRTDSGVDVDGWDGESLTFKGNSQLELPYKPFASFNATTGYYIEFNIKVDTILDSDLYILKCLNSSNKGGFYLKAEEAGMITETGTVVSTPIAAGSIYNIGFMIKQYTGMNGTNEVKTILLELFVNGIRSGVVVFDSTDTFAKDATIIMDGLGAVWKFYGMRVYNTTLTPYAIYNNYLTTLSDGKEIERLATENDVLNVAKTAVSFEKLINKGKNVLVIELGNGEEQCGLDTDLLCKLVDDCIGTPTQVRVCATKELFLNPGAEKKDNFMVKGLTYYNNGKLSDPYSFKTGPTLMQVQGTSSTYYSRKNYDIFFANQKYDKASDVKNTWTSYFDTNVGSSVKNPNTTEPMYSMSAEDQGVPCLCLKADYSDSSNLHNTVLTKLINDVWFGLGSDYQTPAQHHNDTEYNKVRVGINGHPIDVFVKSNNEYIYIGKYNMNNEKKDSHHVFGFENYADTNNVTRVGQAICIEFLENNQTATLFKAGADFNWDTCSDTVNDEGKAIPQLEFRYPGEDWDDSSVKDLIPIAKRPFVWVKECYDDWVNSYNETTGEYTSNKFIEELTQYFNPKNLVSWYLYTEYFMAVDQRSKNMMLASWGATETSGVWYFLPYDGDTALGVTNDGWLILPWDSDEETENPRMSGTKAFMGYESYLWRLVRHYLYDDTYIFDSSSKTYKYGLDGCSMCSVAQVLRNENVDDTLFNSKSIKKALDASRKYWADMLYNFDADTKYIAPLTWQSGRGSKSDFAQFIQGARDAHRDWLINKRFRMLDSKYKCGYFEKDIKQYKFAKEANIAGQIKLTATYKSYVRIVTDGVTRTEVDLQPNVETVLNCTPVKFDNTTGANIQGLYAVESLDFDTMAPYIASQASIDVQLPNLKTLIMNCPNNNGILTESVSKIVANLVNLRKFIMKGYPNVTGILDLSNNLMLEEVNIDCPSLSDIILPHSVFNLTNFNVGHLNEKVSWEFWDKLNDYYYKKSKSCIVVGELVKPASGTATYYFKDSWKSANYMVSDTHFVSILPVPALYGAGRDNSNSGFFGGNIAARNVSNLKKIIYAKIDTKLIAENNIDTTQAINVLQSMFRECTNLEYVNTKGWRVNQSDFSTSYLTNMNSTIYMFYNSRLTNIDLSFVTFALAYNNANAAMHYTCTDYRTFESSKLTHVKYGAGWFNATVLGAAKTHICTNAGLDAETFVEMANDIPDITALNISNDLKTLNFGSTLYNDTTKIPSSVRKQITDKGWIINV